MFIFGASADDVPRLRQERAGLKTDPCYDRAVELIQNGTFGWAEYFEPLIQSIDGYAGGDWYLVANDFASYLEAQENADRLFVTDQGEWTRRSILATASSGKFSSDRTIEHYAEDIWGVNALDMTPGCPAGAGAGG